MISDLTFVDSVDDGGKEKPFDDGGDVMHGRVRSVCVDGAVACASARRFWVVTQGMTSRGQ
jgi:hypothetical protein